MLALQNIARSSFLDRALAGVCVFYYYLDTRFFLFLITLHF